MLKQMFSLWKWGERGEREGGRKLMHLSLLSRPSLSQQQQQQQGERTARKEEGSKVQVGCSEKQPERFYGSFALSDAILSRHCPSHKTSLSITL
jgi:hypothetical protein